MKLATSSLSPFKERITYNNIGTCWLSSGSHLDPSPTLPRRLISTDCTTWDPLLSGLLLSCANWRHSRRSKGGKRKSFGHVFPFPSLPCVMLLAVTLSFYRYVPTSSAWQLWLLPLGSRVTFTLVVPGCFSTHFGSSAPAHTSINYPVIKLPFKSQPGSLFFPLGLICGRTQNREQ